MKKFRCQIQKVELVLWILGRAYNRAKLSTAETARLNSFTQN